MASQLFGLLYPPLPAATSPDVGLQLLPEGWDDNTTVSRLNIAIDTLTLSEEVVVSRQLKPLSVWPAPLSLSQGTSICNLSKLIGCTKSHRIRPQIFLMHR